MDFIPAMGLMLLSVLLTLFSIAITIIVGIGLANYLGLTGIVWWAFLILFWMVIQGIVQKGS